MTTSELLHTWPGTTLARVPYWVYQDDANYRAELRRIFEGPVWNYVCLESDVSTLGDYRTTFVGEMPVIVVRGADGVIHAFENRCAHRGALIALDDATRRLAWAVVGGRLTHHNASMQVFADGEEQSRVVWIADLLPHELGGHVASLIEQGLSVMQRTLAKA